MSDGHAHDHFPLPLAVVGGGCGALGGGRHLRYPDRTPMSNLLFTLLGRAGVPVTSFGDSTGECAGNLNRGAPGINNWPRPVVIFTRSLVRPAPAPVGAALGVTTTGGMP